MQGQRKHPRTPRRVRSNLFQTAICFAVVLTLVGTTSVFAQQPSDSQPAAAPPARPQPPKAPALVDAAGPEISLQSSEALFDIAATLNSCGYDQGLAESDPVRLEVRQQVNEALRNSAEARDTHDQICTFIDRHRLSDSGLDLAQYISLALYITPPPELNQSVENADMPPDSLQVSEILPMLRDFVKQVDLHVIWLHVRPQYDEELNRLHDSLTQMIVKTNAYLKTPVNTSGNSRFLVVVEPMLDPRQTNARVYGTDYVVVASPVNGKIQLNEVRHTYLHYQIEPFLYARATAMNRLLPFLKTVRDAPIDYTYRSDVVALVIECMIRAIEARTMDTGVVIYKIPSDIRRSDLEEATRQHNVSLERDEAARRNAVQLSMRQGYILTGYFYNAFATFEKQPQSFSESIGEMVYGMDVPAELSRLKNIQFVDQASADVVRRVPRQLKGLDLAEADLMKGDADSAGKLAEQALQDRAGDAARANFILARVAILHRDVAGAQRYFGETVHLSKDPRMLAWSHIYLGRIYDIQQQRDQAVTEYRAALDVRDGQPDTKLAAEKGLKQAYAVPQQTHTEPADDDGSNTKDQSAPSQPQQSATPK